MSLTFVSAFLDLYEDRSKDKSVLHCFSLFHQLASTGVPIHLFLSKSYESHFKNVCGSPSNVHVDFIELTELETYKDISGFCYTMPSVRTPHHDTPNFMILMNSKIEFIHRAMQKHTSSHYAWIDFSIFHVFREKTPTSNYLQMLAASSFTERCLIIPGCWSKGYMKHSFFSSVNWRFCGGFFLGDKTSLEDFYQVYRKSFQNIVLTQGLTWEVNLWAHLEYSGIITPTWMPADHNDSIVRVKLQQSIGPMKVVASLTSIPPRLETHCRAAIDSLLPQVDRVYLSVSKEYKRFEGAWSEPSYFSEEPYASKMTVIYTEDKGPATKYLGALSHIPKDSWVFVCDDDQEYHPTLLQRMKTSVKDTAVYQNHYEHIKEKTSGGLVHGYVGLLLPVSILKDLPSFPLPPTAYFVDDQWMSIYLHKNNIPIHKTSAESYDQIFKVLFRNHEQIGPCSLAGLQNRDEKVREIESLFGVKFGPKGTIL